jgi:hypothetical protein
MALAQGSNRHVLHHYLFISASKCCLFNHVDNPVLKNDGISLVILKLNVGHRDYNFANFPL